MADLHLGFALDQSGESSQGPLTIDSSDLTTHAVVVGMTGSGKTGSASVSSRRPCWPAFPCWRSIRRATWESAAEAEADAAAKQRQDLLSGAGAVLGSLLGGRSSTRDLSRLGRALGGSSGGAGRRASSAQAKADDLQDDLVELEQEILDEVAEITDEWERKAAEIEPVSIRLESDDVKVVETALLWIPGS